jgi:hypothetical protein
MKLSELRLGNWIMFSDSKYKGQFLQVELTFFQCYDITEEENELPFEGVLITPEILGKAGFAYHSSKNGHIYYTHLGFTLLNSYGKWNFSYEQSKTYGKSIAYLHQLQNLYFALTGEELNIQL